ncbi:MAG TPA: nucleotidyltransferase domain-containing protein [Acetobacteraceae bacterium]|nr:nucleotidyltransferase domain-containing protein [Acetobacteraceae bacterium]
MAGVLVPPELLDPVVAYFSPRRVILFGSCARGEAGPDSDIDLLVIVGDDTPAEKVTLKAGSEARRDYHRPADVIPIREDMFRRMSAIPGTLSREALIDGITVYGEELAGTSNPDPADMRNAGLGWVKIAYSDLQVARACLGLEPPQAGVAAYHCQQAGEKLLKGFLVLAGINVRRTHEMAALGAAVLAQFPELASLVTPMVSWTDWGVAYRYPDGAEMMDAPSSEELGQALGLVSRLVSALEARIPPAIG